MSAASLTDPVFESDARVSLNLPNFYPVCAVTLFCSLFSTMFTALQEVVTSDAVNSAMAFPASTSKAIKAYGLPKNVLVDVRITTHGCHGAFYNWNV